MEVKAVFLDRDGTIIEDVNYLNRLDDIKPIDFAKKGLSLMKQCGFKLFVVTNQSGIARGYFNRDFVIETHRVLNNMFDGLIDEFYFCPHKPEDNCVCRKPKTYFIDKAVKRFSIDRNASFVVGDKESDIELGLNANITPLLVKTGYGSKTAEKTKAKAVFNNLYEVAKWICQRDSTV